ncbi:MAG: hypothetical protein PHV17_01910 [Candidatus Omnitrophica bacterium]|nr:hypothetical protein [Candidatus Omnitrophota bacterium]
MEMTAKFIEKIDRTSTVSSFRFLVENDFDFVPGQFIEIIFDEKNRSNKNLNKYLSFSSAKNNQILEVTKRLSQSDFSRRLLGLKKDDSTLIKGPLGNCIFKDDYKKICFLVGGIGITPVISIVEHIIKNKLATDVILLYSNRTDKDIAFKENIDAWSGITPKIKVIYIVSDCQPKDTKCISGRINAEILRNNVNDLNSREIFIYGPPVMVNSTKDICKDIDCHPAKIHAENFIGY